ncbi:MAG TPA: ComEC/Rec2 family competence protein [Thermomicrobiales bacterium]|nr:ComEC/Rec2 family competence protein [Thermomicrobiales bacterium]
MESRDNASAARSCFFLAGIGAAVALVLCVLIVLTLAPFDVLPRQPTVPPDQRGTVVTQPGSVLTFALIDVGQGMCVVVISPDGRSMVVDAGRSGQRVEQQVIPYLRARGVERIDYLVLTHPDEDHVGGMPAFLENIPVGAWVDPVIETTNQTYAQTLEMVIDRGIVGMRARRDEALDLGVGVTVDVLWPVDPMLLSSGQPDTNSNSIVLQVTHGSIRLLITGDVDARAEARLIELETNEDLRSDVLVVAHHGSRTSSTAPFLDIVSPSVGLIPVGLDNQYGHPHDEVVQRLRFRSVRIYRTDLDGTIEVVSDGESYQVTVLGPGGAP